MDRACEEPRGHRLPRGACQHSACWPGVWQPPKQLSQVKEATLLCPMCQRRLGCARYRGGVKTHLPLLPTGRTPPPSSPRHSGEKESRSDNVPCAPWKRTSPECGGEGTTDPLPQDTWAQAMLALGLGGAGWVLVILAPLTGRWIQSPEPPARRVIRGPCERDLTRPRLGIGAGVLQAFPARPSARYLRWPRLA